ncbi:MAG: hypothetical protein P1U77_20895 [Rubripirellula sp.]|nr:hypothetical protein [Rubripirellula sp.]
MLYRYHRSQFRKSRRDVIRELCKGKRVLHVGACDSPYHLDKLKGGMLLHVFLAEIADQIMGIDIDRDAIAELAERGVDGIEAFDLNSDAHCPERLRDFNPEVVVFGETIEHVLNLTETFTTLRGFLTTPDCRLLLTTPNLLGAWPFVNALRSFETQHSDHKVGFTMGLLHQCIEANGLSVDASYFTFLERAKSPWPYRFWRMAAWLFPAVSETLAVTCHRNPDLAKGV